MPLKAKVANKPQTNENGFVLGTIKTVLEVDERVEKVGKKEVKYNAQFEFHIEAEGTQKTILFKVWTGQNLNTEKFENEETGSLDYNRFTKLCLNLELIKESDLKKLEEINLPDVESLEGLKVEFKLTKSRKNPSLSIVDICSLKLAKV